jgi:hypothetical protein
LTVTPITNDPNATVTVNGIPVASGTQSETIDLAEGDNVVEIIVTTADKNTTSNYTITISRQSADNFIQQTYLKASNADQNDSFGASVAIDGDTLLVGAPLEDGDGSAETSNDVNAAGAAYVFRKANGIWNQEAYLKASNADASSGAQFGNSVDISGDTIVVGALAERTIPGVSGTYADVGAAYVFIRNGDTWTEQTILKASNAGGRDTFGRSVSIDGDTIVVGAPRESGADDSLTWSGAAYVFVRANNTWNQQAYLKANNANIDDRFGFSVELHKDILVIGALQYGTDASGAAYVFVRTGDSWSQQAFIRPSNPQPFSRFGNSVSIDENTLAVGAYWESNNGFNLSGGAYAFSFDGTAWIEEQHLLASDIGIEQVFGTTVKVRGNLIAVGAPAGSVSSSSFGRVYIFSKEGNAWNETKKFSASNTELNDGFGVSVDFDEDNLVAGARYEDSSATGGETDNSTDFSGAAYIFQ